MNRLLALVALIACGLFTGCGHFNQLYGGPRRAKNETVRVWVAGRTIQQFDGHAPQIQYPDMGCEVLPGEHTMVVHGGEVMSNQYGVVYRNVLEVPVKLRFNARLGHMYAVVYGTPDKPHITKWGNITEEGARGTYRDAYVNEFPGETIWSGDATKVNY